MDATLAPIFSELDVLFFVFFFSLKDEHRTALKAAGRVKGVSALLLTLVESHGLRSLPQGSDTHLQTVFLLFHPFIKPAESD